MKVEPLRNMPPVVPDTGEPRTVNSRLVDPRIVSAVKSLNKSELFGQKNELTFGIDRTTGTIVVRIVDRETREVIRQIPPEAAIEAARALLRGSNNTATAIQDILFG